METRTILLGSLHEAVSLAKRGEATTDAIQRLAEEALRALIDVPLSKHEAAEFLHRSPSSLDTLRRRKGLRGYCNNPGSKKQQYVYFRSDLIEWLSKNVDHSAT